MWIISLLSALGFLIPAAAGVFLFRLGRKYYEKYRLGQTPVAPIDKITGGFVHVRGAVACSEPLTSPLTQLPCCYYRTTLSRLTRSTQGVTTQTSYSTVYSEPTAKAFYLDDGTGKVLVNPDGAEYDVPQTFCTHLSTHTAGLTGTVMDPSVSNGMPTEQRLRDFIAQHAHDPGGQVHVAGDAALEQRVENAMAVGATTYRLTEYCLLDKQACSVLGTSDVNRTSTNGAANLVHKGGAQSTFVITNRTDRQEASQWLVRGMAGMIGGVALAAVGAIGLLGALVAAL